MRNETLTNEKCKLLINRFLSKVNKNNKYMFDEAIHLVTQWKDSIESTLKYLNLLRTSVAKIIPQYSRFMTSKGANHCLKESNFPKLTALNVGCKVMLLINELKEYKLIDGSIGIVIEIMCEHKDGPRHIPYELPACVIIEFKAIIFSEETKWQTDLENTYVPINRTTIRCDKNWCIVTSIPSRVCKAITIHKA